MWKYIAILIGAAILIFFAYRIYKDVSQPTASNPPAADTSQADQAPVTEQGVAQTINMGISRSRMLSSVRRRL